MSFRSPKYNHDIWSDVDSRLLFYRKPAQVTRYEIWDNGIDVALNDGNQFKLFGVVGQGFAVAFRIDDGSLDVLNHGR